MCKFSLYKDTKILIMFNIFGSEDFPGNLLNPKFDIRPRKFFNKSSNALHVRRLL